MRDLNDEIQKLKSKGMSLRRIAAALGVSHVTVLKRLRVIEADRQVVTNKGGKGTPGATKENGSTLSGSTPHSSRVPNESEDTGNRAVTKQTPSLDKRGGGNPSGNPFLITSEGSETGIPNSLSDLFGAMKEFLESQGVQLYQMQVSGEAYQVKHNGQIIRFYVQRN